MKVILGIICGLVVLFAGGCALLLAVNGITEGGGVMLLALIPGAIAVLNVLILMGLYGKSAPETWAFYLLAFLDIVAAVLMAVFWKSISFQVSDIWTIAIPVIAVLLLKAVLTVLVVRQLPSAAARPPAGPPDPRQG